ncbi:helix-turn-helix transcriptional regulator [Bacillus pumilus]|uniref:helix-turn-helix transcriptional regulator n=1 Tax=Bacillus pumilus TaxID=1408 RepID=UPI0007764F13|nr:helix-turn-helix transcriptional regulator [Bacillus pumilus]AMM96048.1 XRE family transcriptional regulator [Bacillus pumilus]MDH3150029.1 helix-turn-helix transcriptional regulator [Bacillus pumilus]
MEIKNRIKVLRAERDWTQKDLAEKLGVTRQTVAAIENGKYSLSLKLAFQIARIFEVDLYDVFQEVDKEEQQ